MKEKLGRLCPPPSTRAHLEQARGRRLLEQQAPCDGAVDAVREVVAQQREDALAPRLAQCEDGQQRRRRRKEGLVRLETRHDARKRESGP